MGLSGGGGSPGPPERAGRAAASCGRTRRVRAERNDELLRAAGAPDFVTRETAEDPPPGGPQAPPAASTWGGQVIPRKQPGHAGSMTGPFRVMGVSLPGFGTPVAHASHVPTEAAKWRASEQGHSKSWSGGGGEALRHVVRRRRRRARAHGNVSPVPPGRFAARGRRRPVLDNF